MVPGFFSFALNTVFFQNCVQNHLIVTTISTICFLYTLYPCMFFPARYNAQSVIWFSIFVIRTTLASFSE